MRKLMQRLARTAMAGLVIGLAGGCNFFAPPSDIQTENLQSEIARTQIAAIRATATVNSERLLITAEFAGQAIDNAAQQTTRIAATLIALGTPFIESLALENPGLPPAQPPPVTAVGPSVAALATLAPGVIPTSTAPTSFNPLITPGIGGGARGGATLVLAPPTAAAGNASPAGAATLDPNGPNLVNIQVATSVGADDCAVNPSSVFTSGVAGLYVVATARNIPAGANLSARFTRDGAEVRPYDWTPDFAINGACIWFWAPAEEVTYTVGAWAVTLAINGVPVGPPVAFTISA